MVFARIPCALLSLDAEDAVGIPQEDLRHDVTRTRLDLDGRPLGEERASLLSETSGRRPIRAVVQLELPRVPLGV